MTDQGIIPVDIKNATKFFTALGDPVRLQILTILGNVGRRNVGEIAGQFELSRPAISHHLKIMKDAGIVASQKNGQEVYYWLAQKKIVACLRKLADETESLQCGD
ncbi:MAG: ArsR/SmtB family transcription factor [Candidatus Pristimantibacillus sp.]